jgi:hypothetical protein
MYQKMAHGLGLILDCIFILVTHILVARSMFKATGAMTKNIKNGRGRGVSWKLSMLQEHGGSSKECKQCGDMLDDIQKSNYFPEEPQIRTMSEVPASVAGVRHIDGLDVKRLRL